MKVLLLSDSHLYNEILENVLRNVKSDLIIHCGDGVFHENDPLLNKIYTVRGNHDLPFLPINQSIDIDKYKCLITHGHFFHIYAGYDELYQYMVENQYDICFHGHTHVPHVEYYHDKLMINPGSIMFNRGSSECGSYAIVDVDDHHIQVTFYNSQTLKQIPQKTIDDGQLILNEFKKIVKMYK